MDLEDSLLENYFYNKTRNLIFGCFKEVSWK